MFNEYEKVFDILKYSKKLLNNFKITLRPCGDLKELINF
jgi:hypothetical protein